VGDSDEHDQSGTFKAPDAFAADMDRCSVGDLHNCSHDDILPVGAVASTGGADLRLFAVLGSFG
jgi:hypothetical protein